MKVVYNNYFRSEVLNEIKKEPISLIAKKYAIHSGTILRWRANFNKTKRSIYTIDEKYNITQFAKKNTIKLTAKTFNIDESLVYKFLNQFKASKKNEKYKIKNIYKEYLLLKNLLDFYNIKLKTTNKPITDALINDNIAIYAIINGIYNASKKFNKAERTIQHYITTLRKENKKYLCAVEKKYIALNLQIKAKLIVKFNKAKDIK